MTTQEGTEDKVADSTEETGTNNETSKNETSKSESTSFNSKLQGNPLTRPSKPIKYGRPIPSPSPRARRTRSVDRVSRNDAGSERFMMLSQPRSDRTLWWTRYGPRVTWGDQSTIEPISDAALKAEATERVLTLAKPKKKFQEEEDMGRPQYFYSCGRASQILETSPAAMKAEAGDRVVFLATPKATHSDFIENRPQFVYSCGRSSALWAVSKAAMGCGDRERTMQLSRHKDVHRDFKPSKTIQTIIREATLNAKPNPHLDGLAQAKTRDSDQFRLPTWMVSTSAQNANASNRSIELAKPKGYAEGYAPEREVQWSVSRSARRAVASTRISQLSEPIVRASMDHVQFNPDAFIVKPNALKGTIPRRIAELAQPIAR